MSSQALPGTEGRAIQERETMLGCESSRARQPDRVGGRLEERTRGRAGRAAALMKL